MPCTDVSHEGEVEVFYRGLGRPQGMAFMRTPASTWLRRSPAVKAWCGSTRTRSAELFLFRPSIVGVAFTASRAMAVTRPAQSIVWT